MGMMDGAGILTTDDVCLAVREAGFALGPETSTSEIRVCCSARISPRETPIRRAVADWLPRRVSWPNSCDWIRDRLPDVVEDRELLRHAEKVLQVYEGLSVDPSDCVLVHSDVGLHNVAVDDATDAVNGIFDYDSAAWADRHHDFRYMVFDFGEDNLLEAALSVYEPIVGRTIDVMRVKLYNAICAFSYLAFRRGAPPYERSCGRTLNEDLRWANHALAQLDCTRQSATAMMSARVAGATTTPIPTSRSNADR